MFQKNFKFIIGKRNDKQHSNLFLNRLPTKFSIIKRSSMAEFANALVIHPRDLVQMLAEMEDILFSVCFTMLDPTWHVAKNLNHNMLIYIYTIVYMYIDK
jgi:hypothetical protein